ncbi:MAG: glycosyltransferase family 39 protein [bacterium]|nr:glycosyltransferase family 39 protein [bacterium]
MNINIIQKIGTTIVIGILIVYFLFFLYHCIMYIIYPYDLDNEEGFILNQTKLLAQGKTIYPTLNDYPYTVGNYPPVFQLVCVPLTWIFGNSHAIGRTLSVLSTLLIGLIVFLIVKRITNTNTPAFIAALFPFATHYFYRWAAYNRVDMLALFFSLLGIYLIWRIFEIHNSKSKISGVLIPCILFILAFYTKQSMVAAPVAAAIYLFMKDKKQARMLVFVYLVGIIIVFLVGNTITSGEFYQHLVVYNMNPFSWFTVWLYAKNLIYFYPIFLMLVLFALFALGREKINILFSLYFSFSVIVALSCGKVGSAVNYLLELIAASSILFGISINKFRISKPMVINVLLIVQLVWIYHIPYKFEYGETPTKKDWFYARETEKYIQQTMGMIVSDDAAMLVRNYRPVLFQPFIMSTLARQKLWDQTPVVNDLNQQKFDLIILYFDVNRNPDLERYTEEMINAIRTNYHLVDHLGKYWVYSRDSKL